MNSCKDNEGGDEVLEHTFKIHVREYRKKYQLIALPATNSHQSNKQGNISY